MGSEAGLTSTDLLRDIRTEFMGTYQRVVGRHSRLGDVMRLGVPSTKRTEFYGYHESPPSVDRWDRGKDIGEDAFLLRAYSVTNLDWGKAIGMHEDDVDDLQLGNLMDTARKIGVRAGQLAEEVFFQILQGSANARLLEAIPLAPDGAGLFATTAAGAARFGASSGNLLTGSGIADPAAIRSDFWALMEQFKLFQDTEGQPLLPEDLIDQGVTIVYNIANDEVFRECFKQARTVQTVTNVAGTENVAAAAVTNTILESGLNVTLWGTQRISDNDWYAFLKSEDAGPKAVFEQLRQSPRTIEETRENSDRARRRKLLAILLDMRAGYGVNLPYTAIKVNN